MHLRLPRSTMCFCRHRHLGMGQPDVVMACAGDVPTLETLTTADLLSGYLPQLKVRVIDVVDLMKLQPQSEHPHGLSDKEFDTLFTTDKPIIFASHGYPCLIHRLTYRRTNHKNHRVRGYKEEGTTTPFDMTVMNDLDRFLLVGDVVDRLPQLGSRAAYVKQTICEKLIEHKQYISEYGDDLPEIRNWKGSRKGSDKDHRDCGTKSWLGHSIREGLDEGHIQPSPVTLPPIFPGGQENSECGIWTALNEHVLLLSIHSKCSPDVHQEAGTRRFGQEEIGYRKRGNALGAAILLMNVALCA